MDEDYKNVRLPLAISDIVERIDKMHFFKDRLDICRFAMAYAIKEFYDQFEPLEVEKNQDAKGLNYNVGSIDGDKEIAKLLEVLYPGEPPYKVTRGLMIFGLEKMKVLLDQNKLFPLNQIM